MNIEFIQDSIEAKIEKVELIIFVDKKSITKMPMYKSENIWRAELELVQGEYMYKFLINGTVEINDPEANIYELDEKNEVWSVAIINAEGQRLYNNTQYTVHIDKYSIDNSAHEKYLEVNKRDFSILVDQKVVARFEFTNVTGLHSTTVLWCTPSGKIYNSTDSALYTISPADSATTLFLLDLSTIKDKELLGLWSIKFLVDGAYVLEDKFQLRA